MVWRRGRLQFPAPKATIRVATPRTRRHKSAKAVTGGVLTKLLATCANGSLRDLRDRAILMVPFASAGRRRSEIAGLRREQLTIKAPIEVPHGPPLPSPPLPSLAIHIGRIKTKTCEADEIVYFTDRPVEAPNAWMAAAKIESGSVFREAAAGQRCHDDRSTHSRSMRLSSSDW